MANKANFTPEEWKTLLEGAMMSGLAVTAAEPSGILGVSKESFASSKALIEGRSGSDELVRAIEAEFERRKGGREPRMANVRAEIACRAIRAVA
jgi:hypothetical protein